MNFDGIVAVMLTPFDEKGQIDWPGYARLIDWYLDHGVDGLFAVCQSSEMFFLSLDERRQLASFTVNHVAGRVPVLASGHISDTFADQLTELRAMAETGIDALVLVTNRVADRSMLNRLLSALPPELPLGLYECPWPQRQLLSEDDIRFCAASERFVVLKDVCCDLAILKRRLALCAGTRLTIQNANAAIAWPAMQAGATGFCGVLNNIHPDLYAWMLGASKAPGKLAEELANFLAMAALIESQGYPGVAKRYHQRIGTFDNIDCRSVTDDIHDKYWGLEALLDRIHAGTEAYREKINA